MKKFVALISGGKDSIYSIVKLIKKGYVLTGLIHLKTSYDLMIDSFMFQTVGNQIIKCYGKCLQVPLFVINTDLIAIRKTINYFETYNDEVEDLYEAIKYVRGEIDFEYVCSGAILSQYQKNRIDNVCERLRVKSIAPLYGLDQKKLLDEMIAYGIEARVVKIAGGGLNKEAINKDLKYIRSIYDVSKYKDINYCGEGGEYETVVLNCPIFKYKIIIKKYEVFRHPHEIEIERIDSVYYMKIYDFYTGSKDNNMFNFSKK